MGLDEIPSRPELTTGKAGQAQGEILKGQQGRCTGHQVEGRTAA